MRRSLNLWAETVPAAVVAGSEAQVTFCIEDAKADIAELAREVEQLGGKVHAPSDDPAAGKVVVGIGPIEEGEVSMILLGVPEDAWHYMKDGRTHTFDLTTVGLPVHILMYGGIDHEAVTDIIRSAFTDEGVPILDKAQDFAIKDPDNG